MQIMPVRFTTRMRLAGLALFCVSLMTALPAAAETVTQPPAEYKPLPNRPTVKFDNSTFARTQTGRFLPVCAARSHAATS